ncbi:MAG: hypothetical protein QUS11_09465 [Candidatus Fermentibacter sp.]|nr:hypothetical protein [Candidatus Fermentibacter sp.]
MAAPLILHGLSCKAADGVPNSSITTPSDSVRVLAIVDSIGAEYGTGEYSLGDIADIDISPTHEVLVLDRIGCCIKVYSADGGFIRRIGRHGSGPGEMLAPVFMEVLGDGSICVRDESGWLTLSADGAYLGLVQTGTSSPMQMVSVGSSDLVGIRSELLPQNGQFIVSKSVARWPGSDPDTITATYFNQEFELDPEDIATDLVRADLFPMLFTAGNGLVFVAPDPQERAEILVFYPDGSPHDTLRLEYPVVPKSEAEIIEERAYIESFFQRTTQTLQVEWEPLPDRPMIGSLGIDSLGNLWVQRGTELSPTFDVIDGSGAILYSAVLPDREDAADWRFEISPQGILAVPQDPGLYPVVSARAEIARAALRCLTVDCQPGLYILIVRKENGGPTGKRSPPGTIGRASYARTKSRRLCVCFANFIKPVSQMGRNWRAWSFLDGTLLCYSS